MQQTCLVCLETKSAMKDFYLSCHYNTMHKDKYDMYTGTARAANISDLRPLSRRTVKELSLHDTSKGKDVFNTLKIVVSEHRGFDKLSAVVTDGAPSMQGRRTGFTGLLQQSGIDSPILHCIIHQEALFAKKMTLSHGFSDQGYQFHSRGELVSQS